jgi:hypothetical protein
VTPRPPADPLTPFSKKLERRLTPSTMIVGDLPAVVLTDELHRSLRMRLRAMLEAAARRDRLDGGIELDGRARRVGPDETRALDRVLDPVVGHQRVVERLLQLAAAAKHSGSDVTQPRRAEHGPHGVEDRLLVVGSQTLSICARWSLPE